MEGPPSAGQDDGCSCRGELMRLNKRKNSPELLKVPDCLFLTFRRLRLL